MESADRIYVFFPLQYESIFDCMLGQVRVAVHSRIGLLYSDIVYNKNDLIYV